jgi:hypothetical protein
MDTGITHHYGSLRRETLKFVQANIRTITKAFNLVSSRRRKPQSKIRRAVELIDSLGPIHFQGRRASPLNGLTPTLACLDPESGKQCLNAQRSQHSSNLQE